MTTSIRKDLRKKLIRLLKKHKKLQIFWRIAEGFDISIQIPKGKNTLFPYKHYQFFQQKIFQLTDFPDYAYNKTIAFKSAGLAKIHRSKKKEIIWECRFSTHCGGLVNLEKSYKDLEKQSFYFDFDGKFNLLRYNKNFDVELWLRYDYLFELDVYSAEVVSIPKNETITQTLKISKKTQNYWITTARSFSKPLYAQKQEKHKLYTPPTSKELPKYHFPGQSVCKPFLSSVN